MALIKCPECARDVSSHAEACPKCGCPILAQTSITVPTPASTPPSVQLHTPASAKVMVVNMRLWSPGVAALLSLFLPGAGQIYKGQILNGFARMFFVFLGYFLLIIPGLMLHFFCILGAASGNPVKQA